MSSPSWTWTWDNLAKALCPNSGPASMLEPASTVAPVSPPAAASYYSHPYRANPEHHHHPEIGQASQRSTPRRSVSSMTTLFPLTLLSSSPSSTKVNRSSSSSASCSSSPAARGKMKAEPPRTFAAMNLPELLIQNLRESENFMPRYMTTAGFPSQKIAITHTTDDDHHAFQAPSVPRYRTVKSHPPLVARPRARSLAPSAGERKPKSNPVGLDVGESKQDEEQVNLGYSSESSAGMEPLSVRTREQSVTTTRTSVSGRCSSLLSQHPVAPSPIPSQTKMDQARQGSWFDVDDDCDDETSSSCSSSRPASPPPGPSLSRSAALPAPSPSPSLSIDSGRLEIPPRPASAMGFYGINVPDTSPSLSGAALSPSPSPNLYFSAAGRAASDQRPHTSAGHHPLKEKPRIVEIQPPIPKRKSSLRRTGPAVLKMPAMADERTHDHDESTLVTARSTMTLLPAPYGRRVIDASRRPSLDSARRDQVPAVISNNNNNYRFDDDDDDDGDEFDEGDDIHKTSDVGIYPERPAHTDKSSAPSIQSWLDSGVEVSTAPRMSGALPSAPINVPGIPLPPDVFESIRITVSNFPETMLLSSSLATETIRAYSRKLTHPPGSTSHLKDDNESVFSFSAASTKKSKLWKFSRLTNSRRAKQKSKTCIRTSATAPSITSVAHSAAAVTPHWMSMKNIFPSGSDYLCEALYAHLVAYNYMSTICPPPVISWSSTVPSINRSASPDPSQDTGRRVPTKAASLLGMQNDHHMRTASPSSSRHLKSHRQAFYDSQRTPAKLRKGGGGGGGGSGVIEMAAVRDLVTELGRCIAMLVATLQPSTYDVKAGTSHVVMQPKDERKIDPVLMRALCEVVRCSEEGIS
ncbi:hypothetical protein B0T19DRAFT_9496 [Cercophora scortea]|uniref:Uncharacterized protein n=1 Tax=Cercophora scortea TaxID=314031 RepID=A0AAE0J223_9PEZI|nr:hypothetical protein B0T19DRAFT_9496 [Cercophora scortea]